MSAYEKLPVYKSASDLAEYIDGVVCHFAKRHKYTVGAKLLSAALDALLLIAAAVKKEDRSDCLKQAIEKLEEMKILLRFSKNRKAFNSFHSFEVSTKKVINVAKQCEGWLKYQNSLSGAS